MTQDNPPTEPSPALPVPQPADPPASAKPPKRRRRTWVWVLGGLGGVVLLLLLLVLLAPAILSTGFVRSTVVSDINKQLNGKLSIDSWSFSWGGNVSADGIRLLDADGRQVLQLAHFEAHPSLSRVIAGKYYLGKVLLSGLDFYIVRYRDGSLNIEKIARPSNKPAGPSKAPKKKEPSKLPDLSVELVLSPDSRGTIEDQQQKHTIQFTKLASDINIPNINQAITDSLDAVAEMDGQPAGSLSVNGSALLVKNNQLMTDPAQVLHEGQVEQKISLDGVQLATFAPVVGKAAGLSELSGKSQGQVVVSLKPGASALVDALLTIDGLRASGPALKGDHLALKQAKVAAQQVSIALPPDGADLTQARLNTGPTDGSKPISATLVLNDNSTSAATIFADAPLGALQRLAAQQSPGQSGNVRADVRADLSGLAKMLPHLVLGDGKRMDSGLLVYSANAAFTPESASINTQGSVQHLSLFNGQEQPFKDYTVGLVIQSKSQFKDGGSSTDVSKLDVADNQGIVHVQEAQPLHLTQSKDGHFTADGKLDLVRVDLRAINQMLQELSAASVAVKTDKGSEIRSGLLTGTLSLASAQQQIQFGTDLKIDSLTLSQGDTTPINGETVTLNLAAKAPDDLSSATANLDAASSFVAAHVGQVELQLKNGKQSVSTLQMLRKLDGTVDVPSVSKLMMILDAVSPPKPTTQPTTKPAKVPAKPVAGSLKLALAASRGAEDALQLNTRLTGADLAMAADHGPQPLGPIDYQSSVSITPTTPGSAPDKASSPAATEPSVMDQIQNVDVTSLSAHAGGAELALKQPLHLSNLSQLSSLVPSSQPGAASPSGQPAGVDAVLGIKGELAALSRFLEALDGATPGSEYNYAGAFQFEQKVNAQAGKLALVGQGNISNLQALQDGKPTFIEPDTQLADDITLASASDLDIRNLAVHMPASKMLDLALKGTVKDLSKQRQMDLAADVTYDLAKLKTMLLPLTSKETQASYKDAVLEGVSTEHWPIKGSYPAGLPFNEAVKTIVANLRLRIAKLEAKGIVAEKLDVPLDLKNGVARVAYSDKPGDYPPPAPMNNGQFSVSGAQLDLADPHMRLTMIPGTVMLRDITLNPTLADALGASLGNFLFVKTDSTTGLLSVTVNQCNRLPLDDLMNKAVPENDGVFDVNTSINRLSIAGGGFGSTVQKLTSFLGTVGVRGGVNLASFQGDVKSYHLVLKQGVTTHDMNVTFGEQAARPLRLSGNVVMQSKAMNMVLDLPPALFKSGELEAALPNGIALPVGGTVSAPQFDFGAAVQKSLLGNGSPQDLIQRLPGLLNKKKKPEPGAASQPSDANPAGDALNALGDLLNKKKKDQK